MKYLLILYNVMLSFFSVDKTKDKGKCAKCKFNLGETCGVGTVYTEKGINAICYEGELWEKNEA